MHDSAIALQLLTFLFDLLLPLVVGFLLVRSGRFHSRSFDRLVNLTIIGIVPILALLSIWSAELDRRLISLPFIGLAMQIIPGAIAWLRMRSKPGDALERGSYVLSNLLCNRGVLGGLAVFILMGEQAYAYAQLVTVLGMPALIVIGFPIANHYHRRHHGIERSRTGGLRAMLFDKRQAALIGLAAGALLNTGGVPRPEALGALFSLLIHIVAWTLLVPVGASIDFREMKAYWRQVIDILPMRFVLCPVLFYLIGRAAGLENAALMTVVVLSATPTAINAVVTAKLFHLNIHLATAAFVLTTSVYLLIVFPSLLLLTWIR